MCYVRFEWCGCLKVTCIKCVSEKRERKIKRIQKRDKKPTEIERNNKFIIINEAATKVSSSKTGFNGFHYSLLSSIAFVLHHSMTLKIYFVVFAFFLFCCCYFAHLLFGSRSYGDRNNLWALDMTGLAHTREWLLMVIKRFLLPKEDSISECMLKMDWSQDTHKKTHTQIRIDGEKKYLFNSATSYQIFLNENL